MEIVGKIKIKPSSKIPQSKETQMSTFIFQSDQSRPIVQTGRGLGGTGDVQTQEIINKVKTAIDKLTIADYALSSSKSKLVKDKLDKLATLDRDVANDIQELAILRYLRQTQPNTEISEAAIQIKQRELNEKRAKLSGKQQNAQRMFSLLAGFSLHKLIQ